MSLFVLASLDEVTGRFGEDEHAASEDSCPDELEGDGNAVGGVVGAVLGAIVDDGSEEETNSDGPLVAGDNTTTDPFRCTLGLVHGDDGRDNTDTETSEDTTDDEEGDCGRTGLHGNTDGEDEAGEDDTVFTAHIVGDGGSEEGAEEGA